MAKTKAMRVPSEFDAFINNLSKDFSDQTGLPHNNSATMRRLALRLEGKIFVKGIDFDMAIFGKSRKKK